MVDRHYSLNLKPWSARTLYVYVRMYIDADLISTKILRWSAGNFCLQVVLPGRKLFFPALGIYNTMFSIIRLYSYKRL